MAVQIAKQQIQDNAIDNNKLDLSANYTFTGTLAASTPSADSDVAIKSYVDGLVSGLHWKAAVAAATTANITLSGTQTVDGVSLSAGDRILVKDQTDATENGIYVVAASSWSRADDMDEGSEFPAAAVFVTAGTVNDNLGFTCTNDSAPTLGTDNIEFTQFNGAANIVAGDGLTKTGNTLDVNVGSGLEISGDAVQIANASVTDAMLAGSISNGKLANSIISGVSLGSNLGSLSASSTGGIVLTSYNGSAGVSDLAINLDGGSLTTGTNGLKIATGGVSTLMIADDAVDRDKIADGEVLTVALANEAVSADKLGTNAVTTAKINAGAVTTAKIAADAIDQSKIADGAVHREHLNADVVNAAGAVVLDGTNNDLKVAVDDSSIGIASNALELKDGGVTSAKIASGAVTAGKIGTSAVDTAQIADGAVTASKIGDGTLGSAKLNFIASYETLSAGDGSTTTFDASSTADPNMVGGTIVYRNGLAMGLVQSSPSGQDQYTVNPNGGAGSALRITFGSAPNSGDQITVFYMSL
jgi:hypothetical protein